jgi:hypothetical protein
MTRMRKNSEVVDPPLQPCFFTLVRSSADASNAKILIESLREFGGWLSNSQFWVFLSNRFSSPPELQDLPHVDFFPVEIETEHSKYILGDKVYVCAQAEKMAAVRQIEIIVWMSAHSMICKPPDLFDLGCNHDAALRAVHIKNIGSPIDEPINPFWQAVYSKIALHEPARSVISLVDGLSIRPYFNTHLFSLRTDIHLLGGWSKLFYDLITDSDFQDRYCQDIEHQIFLHQAVFSTLILKVINWNRVRQLPTSYSYPLHLHHRVPVRQRAQSLNEQVCPVYEGQFEYPVSLNGLKVNEPLKTWLSSRET